MNNRTDRAPRPAVLLVEDNETLATTVAAYLGSAGMDCRQVADGDQVISVFKQDQFDLVVLDLMLPGTDGLTLCRQIRGLSNVPIIMVTALTTEEDIITGLEMGADDYVCKPFSPRELLARIKSSLRRQAAGPGVSDLLRTGELTLHSIDRVATRSGQPLSLTATEFDLLDVMMRAPGRVFTRSQLKQRVLGAHNEATDRTIDTHLYNLRKKLGLQSTDAGYICAERGVGYRLQAAPGQVQ